MHDSLRYINILTSLLTYKLRSNNKLSHTKTDAVIRQSTGPTRTDQTCWSTRWHHSACPGCVSSVSEHAPCASCPPVLSSCLEALLSTFSAASFGRTTPHWTSPLNIHSPVTSINVSVYLNNLCKVKFYFHSLYAANSLLLDLFWLHYGDYYSAEDCLRCVFGPATCGR